MYYISNFSKVKTILLLMIAYSNFNFSQHLITYVDFSDDNWKTVGAAKVEKSDGLITTNISKGVGIAYLDGFEFYDGIIECDLYSPSEKAYLGLVFRVGSLNNFECIYFQPHTSRQWDAVQYDPIFNRSATWQLYNGKKFQAAAVVPTQEWFHVKIEVFDDTAKVYLKDNPKYVLSVELQHEITKGSIGVFSYHPAIFKDLQVTKYYTSSTDVNSNDEIRRSENSYISNWHISNPYDNYNFKKEIKNISEKIQKWNFITAEQNHLINLNRYFTKSDKENTVLAKVIIQSEQDQSKKLSFGYSDKIRVFLNSEQLYSGNNSFHDSGNYEDRGYVLDDYKTINIPLIKGENELILEIAEDKFGWGFITKLSDFNGIQILNK